MRLAFALAFALICTLAPSPAQSSARSSAKSSAGGSDTPAREDAPAAVPDPVREAMEHARWDEALTLLARLRRERPEEGDLWLYLTGLALDHAGRGPEALATLRELEREHPASPWVYKSRFRRAEIHRGRREFADAERIYEEALAHLRSTERQGELAAIYVGFADRLSTEPKGARPGDGGLDYGRAYQLYEKVAELDPPRSVRDYALYRTALCRERMQDWGAARERYRLYLEAFDPTRQRPLMEGFVPGERVWEARLSLGLAELKSGLTAQARVTFEDLASDLDAHLAELAADSTPSGGRPTELADLAARARLRIGETYDHSRDGALLAVAAYRRYLAAAPGHVEGTPAAFAIAERYRETGLADDALAAYGDVLARTAPAGAPSEALEEHARLVAEAFFLKGAVLQAQGRYEEAIATFEDYTRRYPTGPRWGASQQGIVDGRYLAGAALRAEQRFAEARAAWTSFLEEHPLDGRAQQVQLDLGELYVEQALAERRDDPGSDSEADPAENTVELLRAAIAQWDSLVKKYAGSEQASRALFRSAELLETELGELERAVETYRACDFGSWAGPARQRLELMTQPSMEVVTERTWRSDEAARVDLRLRNVEELEIEVYAIDLEAYFKKHLTHRRIEDLDLDLIAADRRIDVAVEGYAQYAPLEQAVELPVEGPGVWAVAVTAGELRATTLVLRSDVDVIVKSSPREVFVFAQDMRLGQPAEGVRVLVALPAEDAPLLRELETDSDGVARLSATDTEKLGEAEDVRVLAVREGHFASDGLTLSGMAVAAGLTPRAHLSTDRSAYRPGDSVRWRAIVRDVVDGSYTFERGKTFQVDVVDSQGRPLGHERLQLSDFGTLSSVFQLPERAPLGAYTISLSAPGLPTFSGTFLVQQYVLQRVELTFEQEHDVVYRGEEVEVSALARYYYGEPVADSPLLVNLPDGRQLELRTDAQGRAPFTFGTRDFLREGPLGFSAVLSEENVSASGQVYLATHGYRAALAADRQVALVGQSFQVTLASTSPAGEPAAREMTLKVLRRLSRPRGGWSEELVQEHALETDEQDGLARVSLALERGGPHMLRAEGVDRFGNPVTAELALLVSGDEDAVKLRLLATRQRVEVGETLALELVNRAGPGLALVTFEGETVLGYRLLRLEPGINQIEVPVGHEQFPNFAVAAGMMLGNEFYGAEAGFEVARGLNVSMRPASDVVAPGGEAEVELFVTDQLGNPLAAELALAVVDDSLFALYPDPTPALRPFFEQGARRQAALRTATSCTFRYAGRTQRIDEAVLAENLRREVEEQWRESQDDLKRKLGALGYLSELEAQAETALAIDGPARPGAPAVRMLEKSLDSIAGRDEFFLARGQAELRRIPARGRHRFGGLAPEDSRAGIPVFDADTAFWTPSVVTDAAGRATLRFELPDKATRWRLTSRGVGRETLLGEATATLVTRSDFFVEIEGPFVLVEGDQPRFAARVHNLSGSTGRVKLALRAAAGGDVSVFPATVELGERAVVEHLFPALDALAPRDLTLELVAEATLEVGERSARATDEVPVRPWGLEFHASKSGRVTDARTFWLELPGGREYGSRHLELYVGPSVERVLIDEAMGRVGSISSVRFGGPYHAQVAGDLFGACALLESMKSTGRASNPEYGRLLARARGLVAALVTAQNGDGGWPWIATGGSQPEPSSRVALALAQARRVGVAPPAATVASAGGYLEQAFRRASQRDDEPKAALQHALAALGRGDFGALNRLHRNRNGLSPAALAHTALALVEMGRQPMGADLARLLEAELELQEGPGLRFCRTDGNLGWNRSRLDMTALAVLALERALPASTRIGEAVEYLLARRPWGATRGRGLAVAAVARYWRETTRLDERARVTVQVAGGEERVLELLADGPGHGLSIPLEGLADRRVRVSLALEGRAEPHFSAVLSGFSSDLSRNAQSREPFRVYNQVVIAEAPRYRGRVLPTGFSTVGGRYTQWTNTVSHLPVGDTARMLVSCRADTGGDRKRSDADYLVLEVPLPAGARVLDQSFSGGYGIYEQRDGALVVPLGPLWGTKTVSFTLIGADPGEYRVLPPVVRSAYQPERLAIGDSGDFGVLARGMASPDEYRPTPDELFHHGKRLYEDGEFALAHVKLTRLYDAWEANLREGQLTDTARMLLFLSLERREPRAIVRYFEVIKEKDPELFVPFEQVVAIGEAYRVMQEFERAMLIFRATVEETFGKDLKVAGTLEELGERAGALDALAKLTLEYPDMPTVVQSTLALSDQLLTLAKVAHSDRSLRAAELDRAALTERGILLLKRFLTVHPADPLAPDAGLNLVSAYLGLEDFETASALAGDLATIHTEPRFADAFLYTRAVAEWYLGDEREALELLTRIADAVYEDENGNERPSDNRDLALYILGQIHHARRDAASAAEYYERVEHLFADAREALAGFREVHISIEEVTTARPGEEVELAIQYKNLAEAELLVYKVDLMTLTLREKNLSQVTAVNLAGIAPTLRKTVLLGTGGDLREQEAKTSLALDDPGAYLVICRGEALFTSGLVLVTDLELEVAEDPVSGRLRVQALERDSGSYVRDVDVRVIGSANERFISGETDPRGLFVADGIVGAATVIARHDDSHYAFYRGTELLAQAELRQQGGRVPLEVQLQTGDYFQNVMGLNDANQQMRVQRLRAEIARERYGVQVQKVK